MAPTYHRINRLAIDGIEGINENYIPDIDTAVTTFFNDDIYSYEESGEDGFNHLIKGAIVDFFANFPAAAALPVEILSFSTPSQNGPIFLEIIATASGFHGVIEYSDDPRFPSLLPVTASGGTAVNSVGAVDDKFDYFSIVVPEGSTFDQVSLGSFAGTGSAKYSIYESTLNDLFGNLVAEGTISSEASPESFAIIGENLLSRATTGSAELTEGLYTIKVENQTNNEIAYQLDFQKTLVSLPRLNGIEDSPIDLLLPATATDGTPISWLASGLPEWLSLDTSNGQSRLIGQSPEGFSGLSPSFSLTATSVEPNARNQELGVTVNVIPFASIPELKAYEDTPFSLNCQ